MKHNLQHHGESGAGRWQIVITVWPVMHRHLELRL